MQVRLERDLEKYLVRRCKEFDWLCFKLRFLNIIGAPDRLLITTAGSIIFTELKRDERSPLRILQRRIRQLLTHRGLRYYVIQTQKEVDRLFFLFH